MAAGATENHGRRGRLQKRPFLRIELDETRLPAAAGEIIAGVGMMVDQPPRRCEGLRGMHAGIDEADPRGGGAVDGFARCGEFHRWSGAEQSSQSHRAPPARQQAEFHLGQAEHRVRFGRGDSQVAAERQFQTAAEAGAVDHRQAWPRPFREPAEEPATRRAKLFDLRPRPVLERLQPRDVGTGEKRARAGRLHDHAPRFRAGIDRVEGRGELAEHILRDDVLPVVSHVKGEHHDAVVEPLDGERFGFPSQIPCGGRHGCVSVWCGSRPVRLPEPGKRLVYRDFCKLHTRRFRPAMKFAPSPITASQSPTTTSRRDSFSGLPLFGAVWVALVMVGVLGRLWQPGWNVTPMAGVALAAGALFPNLFAAATVPLVALAISNLAMPGYGSLTMAAVVYAATVWPVLLGSRLVPGKAWKAVVGSALASSLVFYLSTNLAYWWLTADYPHTPAGLAACYVAALPFYRWMPVGDVAWSVAIFAGLSTVIAAVRASRGAAVA